MFQSHQPKLKRIAPQGENGARDIVLDLRLPHSNFIRWTSLKECGATKNSEGLLRVRSSLSPLPRTGFPE